MRRKWLPVESVVPENDSAEDSGSKPGPPKPMSSEKPRSEKPRSEKPRSHQGIQAPNVKSLQPGGEYEVGRVTTHQSTGASGSGPPEK